MSKLVDCTVIAERFGVTIETVRAWARQNRIPCVRPTKRTLRFVLDDVERAITQTATTAKRTHEGAAPCE